jgi:hypothetical protein
MLYASIRLLQFDSKAIITVELSLSHLPIVGACVDVVPVEDLRQIDKVTA